MRLVALLPAGLLLVGCGQEAIGAEPRPRAPRVTGGSVMTHVRAFQRIADRHGGNRAAGTAGYRASSRYVARRLRRAGYRVRTEPVDFFTFRQRGRPRLDTRATGRLRVRTLEFSAAGA